MNLISDSNLQVDFTGRFGQFGLVQIDLVQKNALDWYIDLRLVRIERDPALFQRRYFRSNTRHPTTFCSFNAGPGSQTFSQH